MLGNILLIVIVFSLNHCHNVEAEQNSCELKCGESKPINQFLPSRTREWFKRSPPTEIFNKVRETFEDVVNLEKLFARHLNLLEKYLTAHLLPEGAGPLFPIPKLSLLPDLGVLRQLFHSGSQNVRSTAVCHACRVGAGLFIFKARTGLAFQELQKMAIVACKLFKISSPEVCTGLVETYAPVLQFIAVEKQDLSPDRFCGVVLQSFGCIAKDWKNFEWKIDLGENAFPQGRGKSDTEESSRTEEFVPFGIETLKIVHLADIHVDPHYVVGSKAACENELCCRDEMTPKEKIEKPEIAAGFYGDLRKCDVPYHSLEKSLEQIARQHPDTELIYMTGDLVPHDVWATDARTNIEIIGNISSLLKTYFSNAQIIPVIGNHESHPPNLFAPTHKKISAEFSPKWLYSAALSAWADWIPESEHKMFLHSGYYTIRIRDNFRIVVLNTNLCYGFNFWQLYSFNDPGGQLKWLSNVLEDARNNGEFIHIVGHVPPGMEECVSTWSRNFYHIIHKYRDIVQAQFYGHTHFDELQLYYDKIEAATPMSPVFLGPSLSPFVNLNPGYKLYYVDGSREHKSTWHVVDFETWIYNLTQANLQVDESEPQWFPLYRATEAYDIPNVLPSSIDSLIQRMSSNKTLFEIYYKYYFKATEESLREDCDKICRKRILCNMVTSYYEGQSECIELESGIDGVILPKRVFEKFRTVFINPLDKIIIGPLDKAVVKPLERVGKKFADIFKG